MKDVFSKIINALKLLAPLFKSETSVEDVQDTKEVMVFANSLGLLCCKRFADGFQLEDFNAFWEAFTKDEAFKAEMNAAWDNYQNIKAEVKDIDAGEGIELLAVQAEFVPQYLEIFKKDSLADY